MALHESVSQEWNWKKILSMISWYQKLLMDHTNPTEQSVWPSDPCSTRYSRCRAAMPFFQNLNFLKFVPSNGCNSFNFWARFLKFWILKVLKRCPNHSFLWFFYLLSEKSSYLVKLVFRDPGYMKICKNQRLQFSLIFVTPGTWKFAKSRHFKKTLIKHDSLNNWIFH